MGSIRHININKGNKVRSKRLSRKKKVLISRLNLRIRCANKRKQSELSAQFAKEMKKMECKVDYEYLLESKICFKP